MTEADTVTDLGDRLDGIQAANLNQWFEHQINLLPHIQLFPKVLVISDLHASDGIYDPLKVSGMERAVIDLLRSHSDYEWLISEALDGWRGYSLEAIRYAHFELTTLLDLHREGGMLYEAMSNHNMGLITHPVAWIFEGYGKKVFFDHGHVWDWPNCRGWKLGRDVVRLADRLGITPATSPHPMNPDRHTAVVKARQSLCDDHLDWDFFSGHTHEFLNERNNHNSGSPITGKLTYFEINEGEIHGRGDVV